MENINKALDNFLDKKTEDAPQNTPAETIKQKDGLIERIDKTFITESGKILLRD